VVRSTSGASTCIRPQGTSIFNDIPDFSFADRYGVALTDFAATPDQSVDFFLFDTSGTAFSSDGLPVTPPDPNAFGTRLGIWRYYADDQINVVANVGFRVDSISLVPEPATLLMMATSLVAISTCAVRRQRDSGVSTPISAKN
jgi:hypothetical protein